MSEMGSGRGTLSAGVGDVEMSAVLVVVRLEAVSESGALESGGLNLRRFASVTGAELDVTGALAEACVPPPIFSAIDSTSIRRMPSEFISRQLP
jgi:hypothetical protein